MDVEKKVKETIRKYKLLKKGDKVVVAMSGGKDSTSVVYILHRLGYNVEGLMIDLYLGDWSKRNRENMEVFCKGLGIRLHVVDMKKEFGQGICFIKAVLKDRKGMTGCSVCGVVKRWILNKWARKLKADVIATGHNLDDECQNVLMNFMKGNVGVGLNAGPATGLVGLKSSFDVRRGLVPAQNCDGVAGPTLSRAKLIKSKSSKMDKQSLHNFVQRIKPLFFIPEEKVRTYSKKMKFPVLYERCPCAFGTYRVETRAWMDEISDAEKSKVVSGWLKQVGGLKRSGNFDRELVLCGVCGDPARGKVCRACEIFGCLSN